MEQLKPCPFCGGEAKVMVAAYKGVAYVECLKCSAMMGRTSQMGSTYRDGFWAHIASSEEAVKAWNRRDEE